MYIYFSLLVAVIGAALYLLSAHPKRSVLGLVAFGAGLLVFLQAVGHFGIIAR